MKTMLLYLFSLLLLCTVTAAGHHQSYETIYIVSSEESTQK